MVTDLLGSGRRSLPTCCMFFPLDQWRLTMEMNKAKDAVRNTMKDCSEMEDSISFPNIDKVFSKMTVPELYAQTAMEIAKLQHCINEQAKTLTAIAEELHKLSYEQEMDRRE